MDRSLSKTNGRTCNEEFPHPAPPGALRLPRLRWLTMFDCRIRSLNTADESVRVSESRFLKDDVGRGFRMELQVLDYLCSVGLFMH